MLFRFTPLSIRPLFRDVAALAYLIASTAALIVFPVMSANAEEGKSVTSREQATKSIAAGNFLPALTYLETQLASDKTDPLLVSNDLNQAVQCLYSLGKVEDVDALLESTIKVHGKNWRLLKTAAQTYGNLDPNGALIAGKFVRQPNRGGGKPANSGARDRIRALQLFVQAMPLAQADDKKAEVAQFYQEFAHLILSQRGGYEGWRLQALSDIETLPDYEETYFGYHPQSAAPVDVDGNPIYHAVAKSWETAKTDGERWRWLLEQAIENNASVRFSVWLSQAHFYRSQFGVETIRQGGFFPARRDDEDDAANSVFALHTLKDEETICRLATGVKRFSLPDEFNHIKILAKIAAESPDNSLAESALNELAECYENRRQFPTAAARWSESIKRFPTQNTWKSDRLKQIVGNWGQFEASRTQGAGAGATVDFRFRNAKSVTFVARPIKVDALLQEMKTYLKSDPSNRLDWGKINIGEFGHQFIQGNGEKFLEAPVATWELALEPREAHFDRQITVTTPLQKAGAYWVTAKVKDGNENNVCIWVADTAIAVKPLENKKLYFIADAVTGQPIEGANLEFFGWKQMYLPNNKLQVTTAQFAEFSNADGICLPNPKELQAEFQWITIARTKSGRFAFHGFSGVWYGARHDADYQATKVFAITDRPVYRPKQKVNYKMWIRHAKYDQPDSQDYAGKSFTIELYDPRGEKIDSKTLVADEFSGIEANYDLPDGAMLGTYYLQVVNQPGVPVNGISGNSFRVEEYKKPEFEVTVTAPTAPVSLGEKVSAKITAKYYFGSPVTKATVKYKINRTQFVDNWYPHATWDWCYGPGYWWFGYDYPWYRGFDRWVGCVRPSPPWIYRGHSGPPELVAEVEKEIGPDGNLDFEIDTQIAKELFGKSSHEYSITAEVRDESRRTIVGTGKILVAHQPFKIYTWLDRGFYRTGDAVQVNLLAQTLDRKPVEGKGTLKLLKITYDEKRQPKETEVESWPVSTSAEGTANQKFVAATPGQYRLSYKLKDEAGHEQEGGYIFTVVGPNALAKDYRYSAIELIPNKKEYAPGEKVELQINTDHADSTVLLFIRPANGIYLPPKVLRMKGKSTVEEIAVVQKDMPNFFVEAISISGANVHTETKEVVVPPEKRILNVEVLPSSKEFLPGQKAKVKLRLTDHTGENFVGSTVVSVYDKSVEYISGGSNVGDIREFFWKWRRHHNPNTEHNLGRIGSPLVRPGQPYMNQIGTFGGVVEQELAEGNAYGLGGGGGFGGGVMGRRGNSMMMRGAMAPPGAPPMAAMAKSAAPAEAALAMDAAPAGSDRENQNADGEGGAAAPLQEATVRKNFADTAKWIAALTTGKDGTAEFEIDMPENLSTWRVRVWAMGNGTRVGSGDTELITRKNLIVRLQAPRFLVQTDEVVLSANVHNYLKTEKEVTVKLSALPQTVIKPLEDLERKVKIPAGGEARVDWRCKVLDEGEVTLQMSAQTDEESDAMEVKLPSLIHGILKTESWAGTVPHGTPSGQIQIQVPAERRPEQTSLEIRYSPSLAMAMVDALPYMAEYPYGCTEQTLNRFLPSVITRKTLQEMQLDLAAIGAKRSNLNAQEIGNDQERAKQWKRFDRNPVFEPEELNQMVRQGLKALTEQQLSDGGWGWFSGNGEQSWPHTTAVVVHGLQVAQASDVAIVPGVLENGVTWLARYQQEQVTLLKNKDNPDPNVRRKHAADALDALCYNVLVDAGQNNIEMRDFLYRDRVGLPVYAKALLGLALHKTEAKEQLAMILENIGQFLVEDPENETAYLRLPENNHWWFWYGSEIEANANYLKLLARTDPKGKAAQRLVKYLLNNRKHSTYWNSTRDSALVVEAFSDYIRASGESKPNMTVEVWIDGAKQKEVTINQENLFTYDNKFVLTGEKLSSGKHQIELKRTGDGPLYFNAYLTNFTLEDDIKRAGLEVKINRQVYKLTPAKVTTQTAGSRGQVVDQRVEKYDRTLLKNDDILNSGDLVEVELEIESKNDYEYLLFEDRKAAGFEPVDLRSGYDGNELRAYKELRDQRVSLFVRALPRGRYSVSYRLRAETPGRFSALPAHAYAMYAPELKGNSDEIKLQIQDGKAKAEK